MRAKRASSVLALDPPLTTEELAARWSMAPATLANWRTARPRRGPRFIKIGDQVRYKMSDILAYETRHTSK